MFPSDNISEPYSESEVLINPEQKSYTKHYIIFAGCLGLVIFLASYFSSVSTQTAKKSELDPSILSPEEVKDQAVAGANTSLNGPFKPEDTSLPATPSGTVTPTKAATPTKTPTPTETPDPTDVPDPTATPEPTDLPEPTATPTPTETPTPTPSE